MAGIDKTYVTNWTDYKSAFDWASSVGTVTDDFGNIFAPLDWMAEYEESEFKEAIEEQKERYRNYYKDPKHLQEAKDFLGQDWEPDKDGKAEIVLWNTPTYFDIWLIRNCPIDFIQDRLRQQYGESYIEIKEKRSKYDTYVRPAACSHFKISRDQLPKIKTKFLWWSISVPDFYYNEKTRVWNHWLECRDWSDSCYEIRGCLGKRKLARLISKWGFPAGTILNVSGNYVGLYFKVVIKK